MKKLAIVATDGPIGSLDDVCFDDERWGVRYIVVDTGRLLRGRRVLISPMAVSSTEWDEQKILLSISRDPSRGVSRQAMATALMNGPGV